MINTTEQGLETLIEEHLLEHGYIKGLGYDTSYALDTKILFEFLQSTQHKQMKECGILDNPTKKQQFLSRLMSEITKRGVSDVLRDGIDFYPCKFILFYLTPSQKNISAQESYNKNIFSVIRQLHYSPENTRESIDIVLFINGIPIITAELKNRLTRQNYADAIHQYQQDRDSKVLLLQAKRCMVHFAFDDEEVYFCTKLSDSKSLFLPFNKGYNNGAGNPPNPQGIKTDYLWKNIWSKEELTNIIENYAFVLYEKDPDTKKEIQKIIFPRYHQLDVVINLLDDVYQKGLGQKYLIQHSAGSGKSNSIAWLAHQLIALEKNGTNMVDSVIVVTDRRILDKQILATIKGFSQSQHIVAHADKSSSLKSAILDGKRIIISTIQKFSEIYNTIDHFNKEKKFVIIIDEAHSSQSGKMSAHMSMTLSGTSFNEDSIEDQLNQLIEGRKLLPNASYFAFTATPKNKTLELFGKPFPENEEIKHLPFHTYSMKQAIQEEFILDVLQNYTPWSSYYKLIKTIEDNPLFDTKKAQRKLRHYVESHEFTISKKARVMVDHFHDHVKHRMNGKARVMIVTADIQRALDYYYAVTKHIDEKNSPYKAIVAFSGEKDYNGKKLTESIVNGFSSNDIEKKLKSNPYRFLIVADKFQTGYDEPLLHTMYVDKILTDIKAVQTLSRLNRSHPDKRETFILDFANNVGDITFAFSTYYKTTILSSETDPNKLYDLIQKIKQYEIFTNEEVDEFVSIYLQGNTREELNKQLDVFAERYMILETEDKIIFKSNVKNFIRTYSFLGAILPYGQIAWEKLHIFLSLLVHKLPTPEEDDLVKGLLSTIKLDSYRLEAQETLKIILEDSNGEIDPIPMSSTNGLIEPELDDLNQIMNMFHQRYGNTDFEERDRIKDTINHIVKALRTEERFNSYTIAKQHGDMYNAELELVQHTKTLLQENNTRTIELYKIFINDLEFQKEFTKYLLHQDIAQ